MSCLSPGNRRTIHPIVVLALLLIPLALYARWSIVSYSSGPNFGYQPDGLEYAAGAQSIADSGKFYLQVGPYRVPPRYPPGFSALLSLFVLGGLHARLLCYVPGLFAAAQCVLLAWIAWFLLGLLIEPKTRGRDLIRFLFGFAAGLGWVIAPISVSVSRLLMADESTSFFSNLSLVLFAWGFFARAGFGARCSLVVAGLSMGIVAASKTLEAVLLVPCVLVLFLAAASRIGPGSAMRRTLWSVFPFLLIAGLTSYLMHRSGHEPLHWSSYEFWAPEIYSSFDQIFNIDFFWHGHPWYPIPGSSPSEPLGNIAIPAKVFLGIPIACYPGLGSWWPFVALIMAAILPFTLARRARVERLMLIAGTIAVAGWMVGHVVAFGLYFYPDARFYLAPAALIWPAFATFLGYMLVKGRSRYGWISIMLLACAFLAEMRSIAKFPDDELGVAPEIITAEREVPQWIALTDSQRSLKGTPFDTVYAQALGLLPERVTNNIREWGQLLENTDHVSRLRRHFPRPVSALLPTRTGDVHPGSRRFPGGARKPVLARSTHNEKDASLHFTCFDLDGEETVHYRIPLNHPDQPGALRIEELVHQAIPMTAGIPRVQEEQELRGLRFSAVTHHTEDQAFSFSLVTTHIEASLARAILEYTVRLLGTTLEVHIRAPKGNIHNRVLEYSLGPSLFTAGGAQILDFALLPEVPITACSNGTFMARYFDAYASSAAGFAWLEPKAEEGAFDGGMQAMYPSSANSPGMRFDETLYVTVSPDIDDLLPVVDLPQSAYAGLLEGRGLLDVRSTAQDTERQLALAREFDRLDWHEFVILSTPRIADAAERLTMGQIKNVSLAVPTALESEPIGKRLARGQIAGLRLHPSGPLLVTQKLGPLDANALLAGHMDVLYPDSTEGSSARKDCLPHFAIRQALPIGLREAASIRAPTDAIGSLSFGRLPVVRDAGGEIEILASRLLSQHYLYAGLHRRMRESGVPEIRYVDANGMDQDLSHVISRGSDPKLAFLLYRYPNGLRYHANHSSTDWSLSIEGQVFLLPPGGFHLSDPDGFLAFLAVDSNRRRIQFVRNPGRYMALVTTGDIRQYAGFPEASFTYPPELHEDERKNMLIVLDESRRRSYLCTSTRVFTNPTGKTEILSMVIEDQNGGRLSAGRSHTQLRAFGIDSSGLRREIQDSIIWKSKNKSVATVSAEGVVLGTGVGMTKIHATHQGTGLEASFVIHADPSPIISKVRFQRGSTTSMIQFDCDYPCVIAGIILEDLGGRSGPVALIAKPDISRKHFSILFPRDDKGGRLRIRPIAISDLLIQGTGEALTLRFD